MNITRSLRDVLTTDAKVMLGITPVPGYTFDADYVVATFGPFYIKQASFGASMIVSGYTGADNSDENALNDLKWEVGSHFFKKASAEAESHSSSSSHVRTTEGSAGGDPGLAMQGRWDEWSESAEGHPTVTSYQLGNSSWGRSRICSILTSRATGMHSSRPPSTGRLRPSRRRPTISRWPCWVVAGWHTMYNPPQRRRRRPSVRGVAFSSPMYSSTP